MKLLPFGWPWNRIEYASKLILKIKLDARLFRNRDRDSTENRPRFVRKPAVQSREVHLVPAGVIDLFTEGSQRTAAPYQLIIEGIAKLARLLREVRLNALVLRASELSRPVELKNRECPGKQHEQREERPLQLGLFDAGKRHEEE